MYTRNQMLAGEVPWHEYIEQFVNERMITYVVGFIGEREIMASEEKYFNDIRLRKWDMCDVRWYLDKELWKDAELTTYSKETQERRTFIWSPSSNVSLAKAAARIYKRRKLEEARS